MTLLTQQATYERAEEPIPTSRKQSHRRVQCGQISGDENGIPSGTL
jgi:hypothetical protein